MRNFFLFQFLVSLCSFLLFSCSGSASDEGNTTPTYITISSEGGSEKLLGKTFVFQIRDNLKNDITADTEIYINNQLIKSNTYTPTEKGSYAVSAKYKGLPVNPISINAIISDGTNFKHRILYEDFTGVWCGNCTIAGAREKNLKAQTDDGFVFIGIHGPNKKDPFSNQTSTEMEQFKRVGVDYFWPSMFINRNTYWEDNGNYADMSLPLSQLKAFSKIGIRIGSAISGNILNINSRISFTQDFNGLKMVAFIVEDNLVYKQTNYYTPDLGPPYINDYVHHNVLRDKLTSSISGEDMPANQTVISNEYSRAFQYAIPSNFNRDNLKIIIIILDGNGNALNVREEKIGVNNNYEFL
ncbi:MAG: Omp28-related outer membrane protein [Chryseobacterium jejuense]|uniref:Omp28-related outer membrane protein n=1 Tax=Chryseobacterium jejuense TaxID=445960 RepID=UPI003D0A54C6